MKLACSIVFIAVCLAAVCCGGDGGSPTSPTPTTLSGTWRATRAEFVGAANPSQRVEAVSLGVVILLTLESGGSFTQQTTEPGQPTETMTGTWSSSKDVLTLRPAGAPVGVTWEIQFDMSLNGSTLTLNGGHVRFDVNNDNQDEEAILNLMMTRQ